MRPLDGTDEFAYDSSSSLWLLTMTLKQDIPVAALALALSAIRVLNIFYVDRLFQCPVTLR